MSRRRALARPSHLAVPFFLVAIFISGAAIGEELPRSLRVAGARPATLLLQLDGPLLAVSRNALISLLVTGATIIAIVTGTVGLGTVAAYLMHRTSRKKGFALTLLFVSFACAAIISYSVAPRVYITVNAWLGRE